MLQVGERVRLTVDARPALLEKYRGDFTVRGVVPSRAQGLPASLHLEYEGGDFIALSAWWLRRV
jgi:predicted proteasome-type protease